jgi:hypothetical protein
MLIPGSDSLVLAVVAFAFGGAVAWFIVSRLRRRTAARFKEDRVGVQTVVERVRAVGKLVGLEVCAKEIATATSGWAWLPPIVLSQARLAMIFNFEKQYVVDLSRIGPADVEELGDGRFRVYLPPIEGQLRLLDVVPYDIQAAKVLGLLDLVSMTADRQKDLMRKAQHQAAELYDTNDARYLAAAQMSVERHLRSLMDLFGVEVDVLWQDAERMAVAQQSVRPLEHPEPARPQIRRPVALLAASA